MRVLKRAATKGDGWLTYFYTAGELRQVLGQDPRLRRGGGKDPDTLISTNQLPICIGESRAGSRRR